MRALGAILNLTEIAPRGRGFWSESDIQAADVTTIFRLLIGQ